MTIVRDAASRMFHSQPGGLDGAALRIAKKGSTLSDEVHGRGSAKLGLDCAFMAATTLGDTRILEAWAHAQNCIVVPMGHAGGCEDTMGAMVACVKEAADVCQALSAAMSDGAVSDNELQGIEAQVDELVQAANRLRALSRANNAAQRAKREGAATLPGLHVVSTSATAAK